MEIQPSYKANLAAAKWVLLLGFLFGLSSLAMAASAGYFLATEIAETYRHITSSHSSLIGLSAVSTIFQVFSHPLLQIPLLIVLLGLCNWTGYILSVMVQPVDERSDIVLGVSTGVVAGLSVATCGGLFALVLSLGILTSQNDLKALADGFTLAQPNVQQLDDGKTIETLLEQYPTLVDIEPSKRGAMVMAKVLADFCYGIGRALSIGLSIIFYGVVGTIVLQTLIGGFVRRTLNKHGVESLLIYTELSLIVSPIIAVLFSAPLSFVIYGQSIPILGWPIFWLCVSFVLTALAFRALKANWSYKKRWISYSAVASIFAVVAYILYSIPQ